MRHTVLHFVAALRAKLRSGFDFAVATGATQCSGKWRATVTAELAVLRFLVTGWADGDGRLLQIEVLRQVDRRYLVSNLADLGRRLSRCNLLLYFGRAGRTQPRFRVPADGFADPFAAAVALREVRTHLFHRLTQGPVVRRATGQVGQRLAGIAGTAEETSQQPPRRPQDSRANIGGRLLEGALVAVTTALAPKLELVAKVRGEVVVVARERNHNRHAVLSPFTESGGMPKPYPIVLDVAQRR